MAESTDPKRPQADEAPEATASSASPAPAPPGPPGADNAWARTVSSFRWPLVVALLCLIGFWIYSRTLDTAGDAARALPDSIDQAGRGLAQIAESFSRGRITTTFVSAIPTLSANPKLEVATAEVTETFTREDEKRILWDYISLGRTVSQIKAPVTYRYHVSLEAPWRLDVSGQTCIVHAPAVQPSLPPALHTDRMEKKTDEGWLRFNAKKQMEALERSLTPILVEYASDPRHRELVRETCRKGVARFVRNWLLEEDHWRTDRFTAVKVIFADETEAAAAEANLILELEGAVDGPTE